ncbi:MAG TPA: hypothetical protein VLX28_14530, partial [Thermoanaerobaculia bacterium]|nr:hypothetical protein [Thermoanaerobaculia bacterium]
GSGVVLSNVAGDLRFTDLDIFADGGAGLSVTGTGARNVTLGPSSSAVWTYASAPRYKGRILVDTDGDDQPDTLLPKASNFIPGVAPAASGQPVTLTSCTMGNNATTCPPGYCLHQACHCNPDQSSWDPYDPGRGCTYLHCLWVCVPVSGGGAGLSGGGTPSPTPVCASEATPSSF